MSKLRTGSPTVGTTLVALVVAAPLAAIHALAPPPAAPPPAVAPLVSVSPTTVPPGGKVTVKGRIAPAGRKVVLQRSTGGSWSKVEARRTKRRGAFAITTAAPGSASTVTYRVRAPQAVIDGKTHPEVTSRASQRVTVSSPTPTPGPTPTTTPPPTDPTTPPPTDPPPTDPTPTDPPPAAAWPGPDSTGVPAGTTLTSYTGECTISSPVTISAVDATDACNALTIRSTGVVIEKSRVPRVDSTWGNGESSVTITDSDVRAGATSIGALWGYNITARRVDVTGGQHSFHCNVNCEVTDSWLHDQYNPDGGSYHNNAFISNGGHDMVVRHNTLHCTAIHNSTDGGCTADVSLFGDFDPIEDVLIENNFLRANDSSISFCAFGGQMGSKPFGGSNIRFIGNVFERGTNGRCGVYGPVTSFDLNAEGNVWAGNVWDTGEAVDP